MNSHRTTLIAGVFLAALLAAACGGNNGSTEGSRTMEASPTTDETTAAAQPPTAPGEEGSVFRTPAPGTAEKAFTYDVAAVPVGASVDVESHDDDGRTTVTLNARGLAPNRDFGIHVHTRPCGQQPADSGPHYQNTVDPAATPQAPSTDPAYANPGNEVWLDTTTDANGNATPSTTVDWLFRDDEANSVVFHAHRTMTDPGKAGTAGDRLACIDETF